MKKALGQTVRDLKREVNKKVLKVHSIEQKVLDATSNEPWGPHGTLLADIAQASRNYHEYQKIMSVIWKRASDTGKNWRHVFKALTVLEYLVANGTERVIDEIREHAYQISTLSDFQYIDSSGRDQGINVRKKSQNLVALVNDKERIQEVRLKAAANRDKFRNTSGGMYRGSAGTGGYGDRYYEEGDYGSRVEDRNGYVRERESSGDRYGGRHGDSYGPDNDRCSYEEGNGHDSYRNDYYPGRGSVDDYSYGPRSRSSDRDGDKFDEDDGQYSSRGNCARADDHSQDGSIANSRIERNYSEENLAAPPSYEEAVGESHSPAHSERGGKTSAECATTSASPVSNSHQTPAVPCSPEAASTPDAATSPQPSFVENKVADGFDEFDPRGSFPAAQATISVADMDLLGSLSEAFSSNASAVVPAISTNSEADPFTADPSQTLVATSSNSTISSQPFEDPFGDGPFKAIPSTVEVTDQHQLTSLTSPLMNQSSEPSQLFTQNLEAAHNFGHEQTFSSATQELPATEPSIDILAGILPPSGPSPPVPSQTGLSAQTDQFPAQAGFPTETVQHSFHSSLPVQPVQPFSSQVGQVGFPAQNCKPTSVSGFPPQLGPVTQTGFPASSGHPAHPGGNFYGNYQQQLVSPAHVAPMSPAANISDYFQQSQMQAAQARPSAFITSQSSPLSSTGSLAVVPRPANDKFETKSTVWADTLNRGLVNLNISGTKTNPLNDIGIDFEAINRKEKRMEKPSQVPVTSTVTMGKAMGSGSGLGRAGASALGTPPNPMMGSGIAGGGFGVVNQPIGMGMGMNMPMNMGMGMNMPMGQGMQMQQPAGFPPGQTFPGGYNQMMGSSGTYGQQPYGGGYR